jgi:hypothetical protein
VDVSNSSSPSAGLPVTGSLTLAYVFSVVVALLMAVASVAGLLYPTRLYPTEELRRSFVGNDVVNLVIGLPMLLGSMWLTRRGWLLGLLFWPGALFYVVYNTIIYVFSMPLNVGFLLALVMLVLSAYTTIGLVASIDAKAVQQRLSGAVPERVAGGALIGLGAAFSLRTISILVQALIGQMPIAEAELPILVSDFLTAPAGIVGGVLLWRRDPFGYVTGAGLLFQLSALFIGLIVVMLLQPVLTGAPFALADIVVVFALGLICFVPFALFLRGAMS